MNHFSAATLLTPALRDSASVCLAGLMCICVFWCIVWSAGLAGTARSSLDGSPSASANSHRQLHARLPASCSDPSRGEIAMLARQPARKLAAPRVGSAGSRKAPDLLLQLPPKSVLPAPVIAVYQPQPASPRTGYWRASCRPCYAEWWPLRGGTKAGEAPM